MKSITAAETHRHTPLSALQQITELLARISVDPGYTYGARVMASRAVDRQHRVALARLRDPKAGW